MASCLPDVTSSSTINPAEEILGPELVWQNETLTVEELVQKDCLPCVGCFREDINAQCAEDKGLSPGLKLYSRQPVLLHSHSRSRLAKARSICHDKKGAYLEVGQTMIIPDTYQGWYEIVPSDFSRSTCFRSIAEVTKVMPERFFTRSNIRGIRIEGEGENQKYLERKISAGSVIETRGTFTAVWKTQAETGMFKKKATEWQQEEVCYLKCVDKDGAEILVPMSHRGKFNAIYKRGQISQNAVYSMKDILNDISLPVKVRLLFGKAPVVPCIFTGMMVIRECSMTESIVTSTVLNKRNVLFDLPIKAPVKVQLTSDDDTLEEMPSYKDAQKLCKKYGTMYSSMIKLSTDLNTDQKVIMHVPSDPSLLKKADEVLRDLDLITDISLTGEATDHLLDPDSSSTSSNEQSLIPQGGKLAELNEYRSRESQTHV